MDLPEILQWVAGGRKTGTLHLDRRSIQKHIAFKEGAIFTSWSNDPRESLGQFLIRQGHLSEEQLFRALLRQEKEGQLIGAILIEQGLLTDEKLRRSLMLKAEETVYDLFLWPEGRFEFKDGELPANVKVAIETEVTSLILEGIRRVDEWGRIRKVFPTMNTTFSLTAEGTTPKEPVEKQALALVASGHTLAEMALELRRSEFETAALLFELFNRSLVAVDKVEEDTWGVDPVGAIQDLLSVAQQRLGERRYDAAMQAYEQVLALDRLNQNAKKGLIAVVEQRSRDRALRSVALDKVPVLTMSLPALTRENFDPQEGFVLSRINGQWDVQSILKLCPLAEEDVLLIFARLLERKVIELR